MAKFVVNLKDIMDVSTRDYISNNVEMFKSTTPGPKGDDGLRGPQGVGVHHMKGTSTTDPEGDFSTAGEYDTYTFYADANEEFPLAWFTIKNGEDPWRRAVDRGYRGTEEEFYTLLGMVEEYAMISLEAMEVTTENREQVALDAAKVAEDRIVVEEAKDLAVAHIVRVDNPHEVTKAQVGLGNADNTSDNVKNVLSAIKWATARTITLSGDVSGSASVDGSANVTITTTVQPNSVALGTDTTGDYMADIIAGSGISVSHTPSEGSTATITNSEPNVTTDITTTHNSANVIVNSSDGTDGTINSATQTLAGVMSAADKTKLNVIEVGATADQTGAEIKVPLFIDEGETIQIDTRTGEYMGRA